MPPRDFRAPGRLSGSNEGLDGGAERDLGSALEDVGASLWLEGLLISSWTSLGRLGVQTKLPELEW